MEVLRRPLGTYIAVAVVLGVLFLLIVLGKVTGLNVVLDILIAATAFAAGFAARTRSGHPAWSGAAVGVVYGAVSGIRAFLQKVTMGQLRSALQSVHRTSPVSMSRLLAIVNAPAAHLGSLLVSAVLFGLLGLILGAIAGAIAGGSGRSA